MHALVSLRWKLDRLAAMDGREIRHRVGRQARATLERFGLFAAKVPPRVSDATGRPWVDPLPRQFDVDKYRAAADRIIAGEFDVFALRPAQLGFPPQWNRDPKTGRVAPLTFGKALNYRDEHIVGDIKYLWEPSRHAELLTLAQAWHLSQDRRYAEACRTLLGSWFEQCPYPRGPHWTSSLEHAMRLISWSCAWHLLGDEREPVRERWLTSIYQHCHFIAGHFSRHSSANNHLLGELTGLFIAATTWPLWPESQAWRTIAQRELQQQALVQNGSDGVNREQAVWYHHEVADMLLVAGLVARANGIEVAAEYWRCVEAMLDYVASIMDVAGNVPNFGDADDAIVARLDPAPDVHVYRSLLATGAVVFARDDLAAKAGTFDDKSRWLLGDRAAERFASLQSSARPALPRCEFPVAGYYVLGHQLDTPSEVRIVADAGRLGYLSIAAHGHADALSFTLSVAGEELLIDPGTFAYHTQKQWRDYFRGTSAHNTVRIDGLDQSIGAGNFLWLAHAPVRVLEFVSTPQLERLVAEHDGYRRLDDPVTHRRELALDRTTLTLTVVDEIFCREAHAIEVFWHFAEGCEVTLEGTRATVVRGAAWIEIELPQDTRCELIRGREEPPLGWVSRRFDHRSPTSTLLVRAATLGNMRLVTRLLMHRDQLGRRGSRDRLGALQDDAVAVL
ncbi:MAG TPA: alginate lyase family protein [Steroidobacteraceae bacterium]|nr:alginate lyase family protein [Steroidobacteraceae bacterium]